MVDKRAQGKATEGADRVCLPAGKLQAAGYTTFAGQVGQRLPGRSAEGNKSPASPKGRRSADDAQHAALEGPHEHTQGPQRASMANVRPTEGGLITE